MTAQPRFFRREIAAHKPAPVSPERATALEELVTLAAIFETAEAALGKNPQGAARADLLIALLQIKRAARDATRDALKTLKPKEPR